MAAPLTTKPLFVSISSGKEIELMETPSPISTTPKSGFSMRSISPFSYISSPSPSPPPLVQYTFTIYVDKVAKEDFDIRLYVGKEDILSFPLQFVWGKQKSTLSLFPGAAYRLIRVDRKGEKEFEIESGFLFKDKPQVDFTLQPW